MNSKILIISLLLSSFYFTEGVFASAIGYDTYLSGANIFCDNPEAGWNQTPRSVGKVFYPALQSDSINDWMKSQVEAETSSLGKQYLLEALDGGRIGNFDGLKTLEVVQNVYHARMNTVFDCAIIESRISIIDGLSKSKALKNQSEILKKLEQETKKLVLQQKQCLPKPDDTTKKTDVPTVNSRTANERMVNTATYHYCHYRKYLSYLESNMNNDNSNMMSVDSKVGDNPQGGIPTDTNAYNRELLKRQAQLSNEIYRADSVLPRAIQGFKEMERTYSLHLLLVIVYDDFVRLRDNLHKYMSPVSQLFEKAYNAMSP